MNRKLTTYGPLSHTNDVNKLTITYEKSHCLLLSTNKLTAYRPVQINLLTAYCSIQMNLPPIAQYNYTRTHILSIAPYKYTHSLPIALYEQIYPLSAYYPVHIYSQPITLEISPSGLLLILFLTKN